jgi:hypothetical protein
MLFLAQAGVNRNELYVGANEHTSGRITHSTFEHRTINLGKYCRCSSAQKKRD